MKLDAGMYVRTKYGVAKILSTNYTDDIVEDFLVVDKELEVGLISGCDWSLCDKKDVTKASHNIIDLIEVGDYVNGEKVIKINEKGKFVIIGYGMEGTVFENQIKTIVTKEEFEARSYKIGE